jgi:ribosomal protein L40E
MSEAKHKSRICPKCGGQLPMEAEVCSWCGTAVSGAGGPQRIRVRKKRNALKAYFEHVRRHWVYFFLALLAAIAAAWFLIDFAQRPPRQGTSAPAAIIVLRASLCGSALSAPLD